MTLFVRNFIKLVEFKLNDLVYVLLASQFRVGNSQTLLGATIASLGCNECHNNALEPRHRDWGFFFGRFNQHPYVEIPHSRSLTCRLSVESSEQSTHLI